MTYFLTSNAIGLYIFKSVYNEVVVGPTNVIQTSKEDRTCNQARIDMLKDHIFACYPELETCRVVGYYSGLRPHSPENKDYQFRWRDKQVSKHFPFDPHLNKILFQIQP